MGEPVCIQTICADDGRGLGLVVLLRCSLEDADQISQMLSFCGQRTANFSMSLLHNLVCCRSSQGKWLIGARNSHLLSDCWSLDQLYHQKTLTFDVTPELASQHCKLPRKFLMVWITSLISALITVQEKITDYMQNDGRGAHITHTYIYIYKIMVERRSY